MKKLVLALFAVLLIAGMAYAVSLPQSEEAKAGPGIWYLPVYNNDSETLDAGQVVVWDIGSSTGDNDNYVVNTTTVDTAIVAGVIWPADIAINDSGTMAIRGVVECNMTNATTAGGVLCTSTEAGAGINCIDNSMKYAIITETVAAGESVQGKCFVTK